MPHRQRRPAGTIARETVVAAALDVVDRDGVDGLTIRGLGEALGVPPTSLYSCFASRNELLDLMYREVAGRWFASCEAGTWQENLISIGDSLRQMLSEHPHWAPLLTRPAAPIVSPARELLLEKLRAAGMSAEQAFAALSGVILGSLGLVLVELALRGPTGESTLPDRLESLKSSTAGDPRQTLTHQALQRLERFQLGAIHEQSLAMMLKGFESWTRDRDD